MKHTPTPMQRILARNWRSMKTSAHCIGTYPKWVARVIRWVIKRNSSTTVEVTFRGRGKPIKGINRRSYRYGLPVSKATKVAIYLTVKKALRFPERQYGVLIGEGR